MARTSRRQPTSTTYQCPPPVWCTGGKSTQRHSLARSPLKENPKKTKKKDNTPASSPVEHKQNGKQPPIVHSSEVSGSIVLSSLVGRPPHPAYRHDQSTSSSEGARGV